MFICVKDSEYELFARYTVYIYTQYILYIYCIHTLHVFGSYTWLQIHIWMAYTSNMNMNIVRLVMPALAISHWCMLAFEDVSQRSETLSASNPVTHHLPFISVTLAWKVCLHVQGQTTSPASPFRIDDSVFPALEEFSYLTSWPSHCHWNWGWKLASSSVMLIFRPSFNWIRCTWGVDNLVCVAVSGRAKHWTHFYIC